MKTSLKTILAISVIAILLPAMLSCSRYGKSKGQSTEFATFIKAYTGGIISDKSTICVELATDAPGATPGADLKDGILTFSPSIKGTARWLTSRMIEFIPESGQLKPGQAYTGKLRLDKIQKVSSRKFRKFTFTFMVAIKEAVLSMDGITITAASPDKASIEGTISLTEELPLETVQNMLEYTYPEHTAEVNVTAGADPLTFHFEILNLLRSDREKMLKVTMKPGNTGFVTDSRIETSIPAMGDFKVFSAERVDADDPYVDVYFTEPLADVDDNSGLFILTGVEKSYIQVENCHVRIFYENPGDDPIQLKISGTVTSYNGKALGEDYSEEFSPSDEKPSVEIPITGNILPDSKELLLPFKAVNLKAVDISVIQIYEDNVLMFLQDNNLDGSNSLRRSGRLVFKRCIRLDSDPAKNIHKWQDYSVDLSGLFKQEAGAIYRIKIAFKQEYSVFGKNVGFKSGTPSGEMVDISSEDITENDDAQWDNPYPDFYDNDYDWSKYNWEDKDNPLKPTYYMLEDRFPSINLLTSNLGVIAKYAGGDKIWVSVSNIISADPVFNAELYVYSYQLKEIGYAKTGTDGMAEIPLTGKPFVVVAKRGGATSYLKVTEGNENSLSRFDVGGKVIEKGLKSFIYGERGVWRPGDTLHVTMILEDKDNRIPDSHPSIMELYTPQGQFYTKLVNSNAKDGFYVFNIPTKAEDPTGTWNAYFKVGGATFHKPLKIESLKPNRLKINLDLGDKTIDGGKTVPVGIESSWLTGPPAAGLTAKVKMTLKKGATTFKGFEGYCFTNPMSEFTSSDHDLVDTKLNASGKAQLGVDMPAAENAPGMLSADIVTTVEEEGGDVSFNTVSVPYSPYSSYVGIRIPKEKNSDFLVTDKDYRISIATVDKNGRRVSGDNLSYSIYKMKWSWWWESSEESLDSYVNSSSANVIASGTLQSGSSDSSIPFTIKYPDWGRYLVIVKDENSGHLAGDIIYVDWPAYRGRSMKTDPDALTMLTFSTDKQSYDVGEVVTVYIPAASKGQALISLENSRTVISRKWVKTSGEGDATYKFKVTPEMAPNFYIHITLVQPHERADNDLPIRLYGVKPILVNDKSSHIYPVITMPDVLRPEEQFTVKIRERSGKPMTYTLAIVDDGLLDLTSFKTPDPWKAMYEREALGVSTWDLYDNVIGAFSGRFSPMFSIGGDENVIVGAKKDNRFNPVVKFLGPFTLQSGSATHKIKLPMYIGSVRVMVVAARNNAFGSTEKTVSVRSPLMVLPTLPRVLGSGEKVTLPVNVFALEKGVYNASVSVRVSGPLKIAGSSQTSVSFSKPGDKLVRFALETTGSGTGKVTVSANGSGHNASQTIEIAVRNPDPPTITVSRAVIGKGESKHLGFSPFTTNKDEWATLEFTSFPSIDYNGIFSFTRAYSYNCSEQISARGITLLAIKDMLSDEEKAEVDKMIPDLLQQLYQRQLPNGGFTYWPGVSDAENWVSSMAGQFMIAAQQDGYAVSKGVMASWSRFQKKLVQEYRSSDNGYLWDLEQAYRLYTLALNSEPESGAMNRLKEGKNLSSQASWMLASAYAISGKKNVAKELAANLKANFVDYTVNDRTFGSPARDKAIAVEAMALVNDIPGALELAGEVAKQMSTGWYMTQEVAFASNAMARLSKQVNTGILNAQVTQNGKSTQVKTTKSVCSAGVDTKSGSIDIKNNSGGTIYAVLMTSTIPEYGKKVEAKSSGLSLKVSYTSDDGNAISPYSIVQGTDFNVNVTVGNAGGVKDYQNLALTMMIPSGWEIFNDSLFGSGSSNAGYTYRDIRDDRVIWHFDLQKGTGKSFRTKMHAAYEGEFVLPAVKCEAMYDARINANTASGIAKVTR